MTADAGQQLIGRLVRHRHEFLAFLERRLGSRALAEDVLHDAFVRGVRKADQLENQESARAWFYRVLRNAIIDYQRRQGASQRKLDELASELARDAEPELDRAVCQCVSSVAKTLKPEYADALQRVEVEGVAVKQFAEQAGISDNNAAVRVFRARQALRLQLQRCCGSCADDGCSDCHCLAP